MFATVYTIYKVIWVVSIISQTLLKYNQEIIKITIVEIQDVLNPFIKLFEFYYCFKYCKMEKI